MSSLETAHSQSPTGKAAPSKTAPDRNPTESSSLFTYHKNKKLEKETMKWHSFRPAVVCEQDPMYRLPLSVIYSNWPSVISCYNKKHLKNVGPIRHCKPFYIAIHQVSLLSHAACAIDVHDNDDNNNDNDNA